MRHLACAVLLTVPLMLPEATLAQDQNGQRHTPVFFETGVEFSTGDFGTAVDTDILSIPFTIGYRTRRWEVSATIPYLQISTTGFTTLSAGGPVPLGATPQPSPVIATSTNTTSGLGDLTLRGTAFVVQEAEGWPSFAPWALIKVPTADDDEGLGTGEFDVGFGAVFAESIGRSFGSIDLGYTFIGEPSGVDFDDVFSAVLAVGHRPIEPFTLYGLLDYRTAIVDTVDDPVALGLGSHYALSGQLGLEAEVRFGLSDSAPDLAGSANVVYQF